MCGSGKAGTRRALLRAICALLLLAALTACAAETPPAAAELLALGEQYLLDLEYEQALAQFMKVIEIEPNAARAYLGAAEAHVGLGDVDSAVAILEQGLAETGSAEIQSMLVRLRSDSALDGNAAYPVEAENLTGQPVFSRSDLEGWTYPPGLSAWDVQEVFGLDSEIILTTAESTMAERQQGENTIAGAYSPVDERTIIWIGEHDELAGIRFEAGNAFGLQPLRGISFGASVGEVLAAFAAYNPEAAEFARNPNIPAFIEEPQSINVYNFDLEHAHIGRTGIGSEHYLSLTYSVGDYDADIRLDQVRFLFTDDGALFLVGISYNYYI